MKEHHRTEITRVVRFLLLGAANSLTSVGLYAVLERAMPIPVAYGLGYAAGILLSALLSGPLVFRVAGTGPTRLRAGLGYATVFGIGLLLVWLLQSVAGWSSLAAGLGSLVVTAPTNYLIGRYLFVGPRVTESPMTSC